MEQAGANLDRVLVLEMVRVTEAAAIAAAVDPDFTPRQRAIVTATTHAELPRIAADDRCKERRVAFIHEDLKRLTRGA